MHGGDLRVDSFGGAAGGDDIGGSSAKLTCAVADSVNLARVILKRVLAR
jgi:hypothetical protein